MRSDQFIILIMDAERCWVPFGRGGMTRHTISRQSKCNMIRVRGLIEVRLMTGYTFCRCSGKSIRMTIQAVRHGMGACQLEIRCVMIKHSLCVTCWVTCQAQRAVVCIAAYTLVLIVCFGIRVASNTGVNGEIIRIDVAIYTLIPCTLVIAAIDWEVLYVMVEICRNPGSFCMTAGTIGAKAYRIMGWIVCGIIIFLVTPCTGVGCVVIISIMTLYTFICYNSMCSRKRIKIIMGDKRCR